MSDRIPVEVGTPEYRQLWRIVDGAVLSALHQHPEFYAPSVRRRKMRNSIVKRVVGAVIGYEGERRREPSQARSGSSPAGDTGTGPI